MNRRAFLKLSSSALLGAISLQLLPTPAAKLLPAPVAVFEIDYAAWMVSFKQWRDKRTGWIKIDSTPCPRPWEFKQI